MFQGLYGKSIAYNEHHVAPSASALGQRPGAADEHRRNRTAAKRARKARKPYAGPAQPPPTPRRERAVLRSLRRDLRKAMADGSRAKFEALAFRLERMLAARARRLEGAR